ncbi:hypothetical protein [Microbulbifer sp. YPW16]|uniref:hypothetical protein n=1 Tax=Microbulbifer sp. YPW16 TaxID=2904242 RepID=UPI001E427AC1|nr:hypothetical protein [Microbulbifer sp. YPW16]UHQ56642.1 hypothetical protein LVE68_06650 [Microbulbifer sp. YPW16]
MRIKITDLPESLPLISEFKAKLTVVDSLDLLRRHIIFGQAFVYPNPDDEFELARSIADHFDTHPANVILVGSGKLGFSIAPHKRYVPFNDKSDVDVAIIDQRLFDTIWWEIHKANMTSSNWPNRDAFAKYLLRGWIRPDKFPSIEAPEVSDWWDFFNSLSRSVGIKIRGAVYNDWKFFESYHVQSVKKCADEIELSTNGSR